MSQIPPWTAPPDYLGAMRAGAGVGLQRAQIDTGSREAADRLRLAYTQLDAQERRAAEEASARQEERTAAMQLRQQEHEVAQQQWQQSQAHKLVQADAALHQRQMADQSLGQYRTDTLTTRKDLAAAALKAKADLSAASSLAKPQLVTGEDGKPYIRLSPNTFRSALPPPVNETLVEKFPEVKAQDAVPAIKHWLSKDEPALPAVPGRAAYEKRTTRKVPAGEALALPSSTGNKNRVRVIGPNGAKGTIQEGDTLPEGWKIAE